MLLQESGDESKKDKVIPETRLFRQFKTVADL